MVVSFPECEISTAERKQSKASNAAPRHPAGHLCDCAILHAADTRNKFEATAAMPGITSRTIIPDQQITSNIDDPRRFERVSAPPRHRVSGPTFGSSRLK